MSELYQKRDFYKLVKNLYPTGLEWKAQINKKYTTQQLEDILFNGFAELYKFDYKTQLTGDFMEDIHVGDSLVRPFVDNPDYELFRELIRNSDVDTFQAFLHAIERLSQYEYMCIRTPFLKAGILKFMDYEFLESDPEKIKKIELVCLSEILNKKDNMCDDNFFKSKEKSSRYDMMHMSLASEMNKVYDAYWVHSLIVMSKLHKNKVIYDNFLTCDLDELITQPMTGYSLDQYFGLGDFKKVNLSVLKEEDLLNKFKLETLIELEQELTTKGKLKTQLAEFIYKHATPEQLKKMMVNTLHKLDAKALEVECELLPDVFDTLTGEDIENYKFTPLSMAKYGFAKEKTKIFKQLKVEESGNIALNWFMYVKTKKEKTELRKELQGTFANSDNVQRI